VQANLDQRPEMHALNAAVQASESMVKAERRAANPTLFVQADYQHVGAGAYFPRNEDTVMATAVLSIPISDGGRIDANVKAAEAKLAEVRAMRERTQAAIAREFEAARLDLVTARQRVDTAARQVEAAEESMRVIEEGYREGIVSITDVLAVQTQLSEARYRASASKHDLAVSSIRLWVAAGMADRIPGFTREEAGGVR
jgi:multidrug efflux system outer membrane protein